MSEVILLNKCPICGGRLLKCCYGQYEDVYRINKNCKINKKKICRTDCGITTKSYIRCENNDFITNIHYDVVEPLEVYGNVFKNEDDGKYYLQPLRDTYRKWLETGKLI